MSRKYLTTPEASEKLDASPAALRRAAREGRFPGAYQDEERWYFPADGRVSPPRREKLTEEERREIASSPESPTAVARRYGIDRSYVYYLRKKYLE